MSPPRLPQESPDLERHYWRAKRPWPAGGTPLSVLGQHIEQQNRPA